MSAAAIESPIGTLSCYRRSHSENREHKAHERATLEDRSAAGEQAGANAEATLKDRSAAREQAGANTEACQDTSEEERHRRAAQNHKLPASPCFTLKSVLQDPETNDIAASKGQPALLLMEKSDFFTV